MEIPCIVKVSNLVMEEEQVYNFYVSKLYISQPRTSL